jgi:CheY-like chemotaxis protein
MKIQRCRVLLVEDNAVNALLVQKMLKGVENPLFDVVRPIAS